MKASAVRETTLVLTDKEVQLLLNIARANLSVPQTLVDNGYVKPEDMLEIKAFLDELRRYLDSV